jgi:UPF0176 protein
MSQFTILAFYHFHPLDGLDALRTQLKSAMQHHGVRGTILLAPEGVNATIAGPDAGARAVLEAVRAIPGFAETKHKESFHPVQPFGRTLVKIRQELISLGEHADPAKIVGTYVPSSEWNDLIAQDDVLLIDGRNSYEVRVGKFKGAVDLGARDFKDFPHLVREQVDPQKHKRVAMYCTGGIRCEKLSSYFLEQGFEEVYHLDGGILQYLEDVPAEQSSWEGECYVFDDRLAVGHGVTAQTPVSSCPACGHPLMEQDWEHPLFYPGIRCGYCEVQKNT